MATAKKEKSAKTEKVEKPAKVKNGVISLMANLILGQKKTDEEIVAEVIKQFPEKADFNSSRVSGLRSYINSGKPIAGNSYSGEKLVRIVKK
jgi:hypothetical protein